MNRPLPSRVLPALALAVSALGLLAAPASAARDDGPTRLAKLIDGRVAGDPERCIRTYLNDSLTVLDGTAIVYERGDTVWVNRTRDPEGLDDDDVMVIRRFNGSQLCRLDQITTQDRFAGFYTGNIFLTEFVPYRKPAGS